MVPFRDLLNKFDLEIKHIHIHMQRLAAIRKDLLELIEPTDLRKASQATLRWKGLTRVYKCNIKDCMFLIQDDVELKKHFAKFHEKEKIPSIDVLDSQVLGTPVANTLVKWFTQQKECRSQTEKEEPPSEKIESAKEKSKVLQDAEMSDDDEV